MALANSLQFTFKCRHAGTFLIFDKDTDLRLGWSVNLNNLNNYAQMHQSNMWSRQNNIYFTFQVIVYMYMQRVPQTK